MVVVPLLVFTVIRIAARLVFQFNVAEESLGEVTLCKSSKTARARGRFIRAK